MVTEMLPVQVNGMFTHLFTNKTYTDDQAAHYNYTNINLVNCFVELLNMR